MDYGCTVGSPYDNFEWLMKKDGGKIVRGGRFKEEWGLKTVRIVVAAVGKVIGGVELGYHLL